MLELRYVGANAEIQNGDRLVTSGIDGTYPAGLAVATVVKVETDAEQSFARVLCRPTAGVDRGRYVLILSNDAQLPPRPDDAQTTKDRRGEKGRRGKGRRGDAPADSLSSGLLATGSGSGAMGRTRPSATRKTPVSVLTQTRPSRSAARLRTSIPDSE